MHDVGRICLPVAASFLAGCGGGEAIRELAFTGDLRPAAYVESEAFGGVFSGFGEWLSSNGRVAVVYRFSEDTDNNGSIEVDFGVHGWPMGDHPVVLVADLESGWSDTFDAFLTADPRGRYAVVRRDERLWLIDSADGSSLDLTREGAVVEDDGNRCMPPRQVSFDWRGERLAYLRGSPDRAVIRELTTGTEREIAGGPGLLWRVEFNGASGWVTLRKVERDTDRDGRLGFPVQGGSCVCDWCRRFAMSFSILGWSGDSATTVLVAPSGERIVTEHPPLYISEEIYAITGASELLRTDGGTIPLPGDCQAVHAVPPTGDVLMTCDDRSQLFRPGRNRSTKLPGRVSPIWTAHAGRAPDGQHWIPVFIPMTAGRDAETNPPRNHDARLARLRLEDGRLEAGPVVDSLRVTQMSDWVIAASDSVLVALNYGTGELLRLPVTGVQWVYGFEAVLKDYRGIVVDPDRGAYFEMPWATSATSAGCAVRPSSTPDHLPIGLEMGPWRRRCVAVDSSGAPQAPTDRR